MDNNVDVALLRKPKLRIKSPKHMRFYVWGLLFLLPEVLIFLIFLWKPILMGVYLSFFDIDLVKGNTFNGIENYRSIFADDLYVKSIFNTLYYIFLGLILGYWLPIAAAIAVSELRRFKSAARLILYLPNIMPAVVLYGIWKWLYDPIGPINSFKMNFSETPVQWLTDTSWAMASIVIMNTWHFFGATMLIYLAAVMNIPKDLYEAAEIDGASVWQRIRYITIPSLKMIFVLMLILQLIGTSQAFEPHLAMTGGGPVNSTLTYMLLVVQNAFTRFELGQATAAGVVMFVVLTSLSILLYSLQRKGSEG